MMSGLTPSWYHATNIALHAIACVLVTRVSLVVASLRPGFAALTGLLFAAHPVHTEAVSNSPAWNRWKLPIALLSLKKRDRRNTVGTQRLFGDDGLKWWLVYKNITHKRKFIIYMSSIYLIYYKVNIYNI